MSGEPPHHPHNRQIATPWDFLGIPNYFPPRQPQHAHASNDHPASVPQQQPPPAQHHAPTWHTPTTDNRKPIASVFRDRHHSLVANLGLPPANYNFHPTFDNGRQQPNATSARIASSGVDLSLVAAALNGEPPIIRKSSSPISLSVRDANKINSLTPASLDVNSAVQLTTSRLKIPPTTDPEGVVVVRSKTISDVSNVENPSSVSVIDSKHSNRPKTKPLDSVLERLKPVIAKNDSKFGSDAIDGVVPSGGNNSAVVSENVQTSVIVQANNNSHDAPDENSNSSGAVVVRSNTPSSKDDDELAAVYSNEDSSADSVKSRRKRKPSKTVRCSKDFAPAPSDSQNSNKILNDLSNSKNLSFKIVDDSNLSKNANSAIVDDSRVAKNSTSIESSSKNTIDLSCSKNLTVIESSAKNTTNLDLSPKNSTAIDSRSNIPNLSSNIVRESDDKSPEVTNLVEYHIIPGSQNENLVQVCVLPEVVTDKSDSEQKIEEMKAATCTDRRKTSSESETIDNIAAMVQEGLSTKFKEEPPVAQLVSVIKTKDDVTVEPTKQPITKAQRKETNFVEVEDKLEQMFAGIDEFRPIETVESLASTSNDVTSTSGEILPNKAATKRRNSKTLKRRSSEAASDVSTPPAKKKASKKSASPLPKSKSGNKSSRKSSSIGAGGNGKQTKLDSIRDAYAYDSGSNASSSKSKGPFIHIKGPRDSPISVNVVNASNDDEAGDKRTFKKKYHDDSEYRHKVRSKGLHCSTLSTKYDAQTKDASWICVFCKRGPHASDVDKPFPAGDLFGPYFIGTDCPEFARRLDDPYDKQYKSKKVVKALEALPGSKATTGGGKKKKKSFVDSNTSSDPYAGILETDNHAFEIWAHEHCLVWSPGTYLIGPKIIGLEEAVWTACNIVCVRCGLKGANVCCLRRGCTNVTHVWCARTSGWECDDANFKALCPEHRTQ